MIGCVHNLLNFRDLFPDEGFNSLTQRHIHHATALAPSTQAYIHSTVLDVEEFDKTAMGGYPRIDAVVNQPLHADGTWSVSKSRPASCLETTQACVEVFYEVPAQGARCSWIISLNENGTDGTVLDENDDTDNYMVRMLSDSEATPLIKSRAKPVFPAIAIAARVSGPVVTKVLVSKSGEVQLARPVSGPPMLIPASIDAAKKWSFMPLTVGARPVPYEVQLVFTFTVNQVASTVKVTP